MAIHGEMEEIDISFDMLQQNRLRQTKSVIFNPISIDPRFALRGGGGFHQHFNG